MGVGGTDEMVFFFPIVSKPRNKAALKPDKPGGYADNGAKLFQDAAARWLANVRVEIAARGTDHPFHRLQGCAVAIARMLHQPLYHPINPSHPVFGTH